MKPLILVMVVVVGLTSARWMRRQRSDQPKETCFIGKTINDLSTTILQGYIDDEKNIAFSPLGYSAILAILAEGATGETRKELVSALNLPDDQNLTRKTYKSIMERLKYRNEYKNNKPELKNFFYIYKNYTINGDYKKILEDYYLTDVKSIERHNFIKDYDSDEEEKKKEVMVPKTEEIPDLVPPQESNEKLFSYAVEDIPDQVYKPAKNIKEQIKLVKTTPDKKDEYEDEEEEETMVAVEARNHARSLNVFVNKNDIASSLSVNTVGKKSNKFPLNLMLIFNAMYFRGCWKKPFEKVELGLYYKSNTEKKQVPMMKTSGSFLTSSLPDLDSEALMLPYDGGRYALMLLVPRSRDGLLRLIADLPAAPLSEIIESLQEEELQISVPTFYFETLTKPVAALAKFGVSSIFGHEAELSGISSNEGLFVQELVQNVAVRVDNTFSSASSVAASSTVDEKAMESLKNIPLYETKEPRRFCVEHPFIFYIIDRLDGLIVVSGKVIDPEKQTDI